VYNNCGKEQLNLSSHSREKKTKRGKMIPNDPNTLRIRQAVLKYLNETADFISVSQIQRHLGSPNLYLIISLLEELRNSGLVCELPSFEPLPPGRRKFMAVCVTRYEKKP